MNELVVTMMDKIECKQNITNVLEIKSLSLTIPIEYNAYPCLKSYSARSKSNYRLRQVETIYF